VSSEGETTTVSSRAETDLAGQIAAANEHTAEALAALEAHEAPARDVDDTHGKDQVDAGVDVVASDHKDGHRRRANKRYRDRMAVLERAERKRGSP
jgi:ketosteroid isomerase-like protein